MGEAPQRSLEGACEIGSSCMYHTWCGCRSLEINAVAEGRERVPSADLQTKDFAAETRTPRVEQLLAKSWPPATLAAWCACGAATLVALGMFAGRPAMQVAVVVVGGTVARYVGRHPSLLVAASLALAAVAISQSS